MTIVGGRHGAPATGGAGSSTRPPAGTRPGSSAAEEIAARRARQVSVGKGFNTLRTGQVALVVQHRLGTEEVIIPGDHRRDNASER
ncbi:hypothetical protein [Amycolatopsis thermophila]|uniref:Uncharacterized protein n=1 Tax=Amycolatopsis thermophila TaxID=206084 RepID=A0ABU0F099_9PSEU|nr:hypothetical protein [Amycolatopsis thermophila]MDQ0380482.1 hypothetical protein [Amycolatopsis thermophila]